MKEPTERELRFRKAKSFLNKNFKLGWDMKWQSTDSEVKKLANLLKPIQK